MNSLVALFLLALAVLAILTLAKLLPPGAQKAVGDFLREAFG